MEPEVRVDTVGVAFPIAALAGVGEMVQAGWEVKSLSALKGEGGEVPAGDGLFGTGGVTARYSRRLDGGGFVAVGKGSMAWVEASLPKRRGEWESLTLADAQAEIVALVEEACQFVTPDDAGRAVAHTNGARREELVRVDNAKVVRLDLVREFRLRSPEMLSPLLDGIAAVPQAGRTKVRRFADGNRGRAETVSIGPRAWKLTLYDKHTETKTWSGPDAKLGAAPPGALRAELRLHADQLRSAAAAGAGGHVCQVSDLDEHRLAKLRRHWWDLTGAGREVATDYAVADLIAARTDWSENLRFAVAGWLSMAARGHHRSDRKTERLYRGLAAELGIVLGRAMPENLVSLRLDYDAGHEVAQIAA